MFNRLLRNHQVRSLVTTSTRGFRKTIEHLAKEKPGLLKDAKVLVRVDFNVPFSKKEAGKISDDTRIREATPTINYLTAAGAKVILMSHCGKPKGVDESQRMAPIAKRLSELISRPVAVTTDCVGPIATTAVNGMKGGDVLLLENLRFHKEEEKNDPEFAKTLAAFADVYVNDAFGTAHRAHASTEGVTKFVPHKVAGFLMQKEIQFLKSAVDSPKRPFAAVVGGAKVSTKISVIKSLIQKCDKIFIGGGMMFTFFRAQGLSVGSSMVEEECIPMAKEALDLAKSKGVQFFLPTDVVVANKFAQDADSKVVPTSSMPAEWMGLDIGPQTQETFRKELLDCKTVVWNGPLGVFEFEKFAAGTFGLARTMAEVTARGGVTIVGGGDSVAAVAAAKLTDKLSHCSTGGGASLEMLEGLELPGVAALDEV